jgi:hypothetical protein
MKELTARRTGADQLANLTLIEIQSPSSSHMSFWLANLQMCFTLEHFPLQHA